MVRVEGVGREAPVETNELGGKQSHSPYAFRLIDPGALFSLARVLAEGARKYGVGNWRRISCDEHIDHAIMHLYAFLAGDAQDDHLANAFARVMMALGTRQAPGDVVLCSQEELQRRAVSD